MTTLITGNETARGWVVPTGILALWAAVVAGLAGQGFLLAGPSGLPLPLVPAVMVPVAVFLAGHAYLPAVRQWVASLDLALVAGAQAWRMLGAAFLMLWALGQLPTIFAVVGGLGDMSVGLLAVPTAAAVARRTNGWQVRLRALIVAGLTDFAVVFLLAVFSGPGMSLRFAGEPAPIIMQNLPMAMIPAFGVPFFIILHLICWIRLRDDQTRPS